MKIRNKRQFFELWEAGVLGNRTRLWRKPHEAYWFGWQQSKKTGTNIDIGFRQLSQAGGGAWTRVPWYDVPKVADDWKNLGREFIMDDGCPDEKRVLQGEICRTYKGLEGYLDVSAKLPMRQAVAAGHMRHTSSATSIALLDRFMDPSSRDDVDNILDLYPDATIEFTTFSVNVGVFPHRNTLFWEVRDY